jgi:hypothetical protein
MPRSDAAQPSALGLKAGEWVVVRSRQEIMATLDSRGCLENMPFMPEMFDYCGKRFRVFKRADKTCQYIQGWSIRRVMNAVHLESNRCDGSAHGNCEAGCLIFWKEAWLKRVDNDTFPIANLTEAPSPATSGNELISIQPILEASQCINSEGERIFVCQATQVYQFSLYMRSWDPRQYIRDLRSGNLASGLAGHSRAQKIIDTLLTILRIISAAIVGLFNDIQMRRHGSLYPFIEGKLEKTPLENSNLQPGELVQVRSKEEIIATLDRQNRNRGLLFDYEMLAYCGGIYRVLRRVNRMVDEKTGKLLIMNNPCIILEGVVCRSDYHRLCPRAIYSYWREGWLQRALPQVAPANEQRVTESVQRS